MITGKQDEVLVFIQDYIATNRQAPSLREIAQGVSFSIPEAHRRLRLLRERGIVTWKRQRSRSIEVLVDMERCPHCGGELGYRRKVA